MKIKHVLSQAIRRYLLFLVIFIGITACGKKQQASVIKGSVADCEGCNVELGYYDYGQLQDIVLKTGKVQAGKFSFTITADSLPRPGIYRVKLVLNEDNKFKTDRFNSVEPNIYLPADSVILNLDLAGKPNGQVYPFQNASSGLNFVHIQSTTPNQQRLNFYYRMRDSMDVKFTNYQNLVKAFFGQAIQSGDKKQTDKWADTLSNYFATSGQYRPKAADVFIRKYPDSELVPFVMLDNHKQMSAAPRFRKYYRAMSQEQQNSFYGKVLDKRLTAWESNDSPYAKNLVGAQITYITGRTPKGEKLDVSKIFKENKLILVDFWASWCDSCRLRTPEYRQFYQTYKGKGFDIISVSLDVNGNNWQKAIAADQMAWHHISDMKENQGDIARFRLRGIPANILMSEAGKIVAVNITPQKLKERLQKEL